MKLLILVLSYTEWPFNKFMEAQQQTWDIEKHPDVDVIYYYGGYTGPAKAASIFNFKHELKELTVKCSDAYEMMHWKFKLALDIIDYHQYDYIFRTNSCSYIIKDRILEVCQTLPKTGCYAGYHNGGYISGAGIFFTPDVLDIVKEQLTNDPHGAEDVLIGQILKGRVEMTAENSRIDADYYGVSLDKTNSSYHFRLKTSNDNMERQRDIDNLINLHENLKRQGN